MENCAHVILGGDIEVVAEVCTAADAPGTNILVIFVKPSDRNQAPKQIAEACNGVLIMSADQEIRDIGLRLKTSISKVMPAYIVPAMVVKLSRTPLLFPSMKLDRTALRLSIGQMSRAEIFEYENGQPSVPMTPTTDTQRLLQNVWAVTLSMQAASIGLNDHFFRLGGDSVSAIQLISAAKTQGIHMKMANILRNPVLSDMALTVETAPAGDATDSVVAPFSLLHGLEIETAINGVARCCNVAEAQIEDVYPCTPLQEGMMALSMKKLGSQVACTIYGLPKNIDFVRLRAAWITTARANRITRTRIVHLGKVGLVQVVLSDDPPLDTASKLQDYLSSHSNENFCLGSALSSFACIGEGTDESKYIVRKMHHAICDGWQDHVLLEQLTRAYHEKQLPKETRFNNFVRYVLNQNNKEASAFWRDQLSGAPPATFPVKRLATYTPWASASRKHLVRLPSSQSDCDFTLSTSIRLAWALILGEYMQSGDVIFGTTLTGRNAPVTGIEKITGPVIATVPLRIRLNYQDTVNCAMQKIQEQAIAMLPYEQTGLQNIRRLGPDIADICDFQTLVVVQPPVMPSEGAILQKCDKQPDAGFAFGSFGLVLECTISNDRKQVTVNADVDADMLDPEQVEHILRQFGHVLSQLCQHPNRQLTDIVVISPEDVAEVCRWNAKMPSAVDRTLHDLFQDQCRAHPMAPAICTSLEGLSYAELDDLSSRLARLLQRLGIGREMVIPLFVGNSCLSAVAILGVLKSGGTCACLDLGQPKQRLYHILREVDAKIALIVGSESQLLIEAGIDYIPLTRSWLEDLPRPANSEWPRDSTSAAFLIFTSGSTKAPKGIVVEHGALASGVLSFVTFCGLGLGCRMLQFASSVFDAFIHEHLTALLAGGCICVPSEHEKWNAMAEFASKTKPNFAIMTSTALRSIGTIPSMQLIAIGGEPIDPDVVNLLKSSARLVNGKRYRLGYLRVANIFEAYGPAECCICASGFVDTSGQRPMATIGYALGSLFWIVKADDPTKLAPIGVIGELLIEGPVLARGYLNDSVQTASAFIEAPQWLREFRPGSKGRLFRSGDLAKYNPDGSFVSVGRKDTQVKLRGCRIELGEIEYHLSKQLDGMVVAAEVVHIKDQDASRLIAFVSTDHGVNVTSQDLILSPEHRLIHAEVVLHELANMLPAYMMPSVLLPVRCIPKSASDKTDRKVLRQAAAELTVKDLMEYSFHDPVKKRNPESFEEHLMSSLWAEVLRLSLEKIGSNSNFFDLGGDSVVAMRLVSAARSKNRLLTVQMIFKLPLLCDLAQEWMQVTEEQKHKQTWSPYSLLGVSDTFNFLTENISNPFPIDTDNIIDVIPATFHQSWEIQDRSPCMVFEFEDAVDLDQLLQSWGQVVEKHEILRTVLIPYHDSHLQVVLKKLAYGVEIHSTEEKCQTLIERHYKANPPAPGTAPYNILILKNKNRTTLSLRISHALYDGWSIGEIWKDWGAAFAGSMINERLQFRSFLYATTKAGQNGSYDYWRNLLAGAVPTCFREKLANGSVGGIEERRVEAERVVALNSKPENCTMATFIKASWALTLARRLSTLDVVMMQLTSGRRPGQGNGEDAAGPCMSYFPVRVTIQAHWRALDICQFIQNQDVESMPFENVQLPELISNCTDWSLDLSQSLGNIVFHESDEWINCLTIQNKQYPVTSYVELYTPKSVDLYTKLVGDTLEIEIFSASSFLGQQGLDVVADDFCAAASHLSKGQHVLCSDFLNG